MANEKHLLLTISGGYTNTAAQFTAETWQTGIRLLFSGPFGPPNLTPSVFPNDWNVTATSIARSETNWDIAGNWLITDSATGLWHPDDYLNDIVAPAVATWFGTANGFSSRCQLRTLKLYPIGAPSGDAIPAPPFAQGSPVTLSWKGTLPTGGNSGAAVPPQLSVVASHRTQQVGRHGRGRAFLPPIAATSLNEGGLSSATQTALLAAQVGLLEGLYWDGGGEDQWTLPVITGRPFVNYAPITQVRLGNVIDTQRRRRRSAAETFSSTNLSYSI